MQNSTKSIAIKDKDTVYIYIHMQYCVFISQFTCYSDIQTLFQPQYFNLDDNAVITCLQIFLALNLVTTDLFRIHSKHTVTRLK